MYSTVRLRSSLSDSYRWGTGFLHNLFISGNDSVTVIVTNRHVVEGWAECHFSFASTLADGTPDISNHIPISIINFDKYYIPHPDVDLVIIPLGTFLADLKNKGQRPFTIALTNDLIPMEDSLKNLNPVEQILTVGYPGLLWDQAHNLPLFHRGYTATAPYIDFNGKREFLVDIATWQGSSGSPVLLFNEGGWSDKKNNVTLGGLRVALIGVVYGVGKYSVDTGLTIQAGPTTQTLPGTVTVPTNVGACIAASRVLEFEPLLVKRGFKPPPGYVMRATL